MSLYNTREIENLEVPSTYTDIGKDKWDPRKGTKTEREKKGNRAQIMRCSAKIDEERVAYSALCRRAKVSIAFC